eukprot:c26498_g1_i1.p1 GENE.c26498_g1_i1~~c26498_g1_i1.p1  ORF type:complete len:446 (-),score=86.47 c26498_g1_i1:12-1298(-)
MPTFLFVFVHQFLEFRIPELESVCRYLSIKATFDPSLTKFDECPFLFVELESEADAKRISEKMVLLRVVIDVWGHGDSMEQCIAATQNADPQIVEPWCGPDSSFRMVVDGFGRSYPNEEKVQLMEQFAGVRLPNRVDMKNPDCMLWILIDIGISPLHCETDPPSHIYLGRQICEGQRGWENKITLRRRKYLGTTSTDALLALLFANQALAGPGTLVWDPCCGTASILVACAFMGSICFGSDVDWRVMHGREGKTVQSNFIQYNFPERLLDVSLMDVCQAAMRPSLRFDAIVTDPPYGIREGSRTVHPNEESPLSSDYRNLGKHATQMDKPAVGFVVANLLNEAAIKLKVNGRLVFLFPCVTGHFQLDDLPRHPNLKLISVSEQVLSTRLSRRLVTMEKISEPPAGNTLVLDPATQRYNIRNILYPEQK